jgi:hypothetical protein
MQVIVTRNPAHPEFARCVITDDAESVAALVGGRPAPDLPGAMYAAGQEFAEKHGYSLAGTWTRRVAGGYAARVKRNHG